MRHLVWSRSLRITALACAASMLAGCTHNVWENISPDPEGYWDFVKSVTSAAQRDDGSVVICVTGSPASAPAPNEEFILDPSFEPFSLILPADTTGRLAVDDDHPSLRRFDLTGADVEGPCKDSEPPGTPLPVHAVGPGDLGYPEYTYPTFREIPDATLVELFETRTGPPAVYVYAKYASAPRSLVYVASEARFDGAQALHVNPSRRPVKGNSAYAVLLPFAVVFDVIVAMPLFFIAAATGIYDG